MRRYVFFSLAAVASIGLALVMVFLFTTRSEAAPTYTTRSEAGPDYTTRSEAEPTLTPGTQNQVVDLKASALSQARYRVVKDVSLNVRDGASVGHQIVGVIPAAATGVMIDACVREKWCHIVWRGADRGGLANSCPAVGEISGWANARFLRPEESISFPRWLRSPRG
jgi:hypothetical protein